MPPNLQPNGFTREQKIGFIFMLIFAILTVGLGGLQLRNTVYGPFVIKKTPVNSIASLTNNEEERLKNIDTDHDGLNDYEELNQYETSPYLPDSDSDGTTDKAEIDGGTDPLCPEGKVCIGGDNAGVVASSTVSSPLINNGLTPTDVLNATNNPATNGGSEVKIDLEKLVENSEQLRAMILSTGKIDAETLKKIDDKTLQDMARKLLNNPTAALTTTTTAITTTTVR